MHSETPQVGVVQAKLGACCCCYHILLLLLSAAVVVVDDQMAHLTHNSASSLLFQVTWFMSGLTLDAQRVDAARLDIFPCVQVNKVDKDTSQSLITQFIDR